MKRQKSSDEPKKKLKQGKKKKNSGVKKHKTGRKNKNFKVESPQQYKNQLEEEPELSNKVDS